MSTADLTNVKLPAWLPGATKDVMATAEKIFGAGTGVQKKAWVRQALLDAAKRLDVPGVPAWIEDPLKSVIIDIMIEALWHLHFKAPA